MHTRNVKNIPYPLVSQDLGAVDAATSTAHLRYSDSPKLRKKSNGGYFVRWGGKDHYLSTDHETAIDLYTNCEEKGLPAWKLWRSSKPEPVRSKLLTVDQLADRFLQSRLAEGGEDRRYYFHKHLRRFREANGRIQASHIRPLRLQNLRAKMLGQNFAPKTINHDLGAVKTMYRWASGLEIVPFVDFSGVKPVPLGERPDKTLTPLQVRKMLEVADEKVRPWLAVNYLTGARPTEVVRAVGGPNWVGRGLLRVPNKVARRTRQPRILLFSAEALRWFRKCEPHWSRLDSYSSAVRRTCNDGPHTLRHSAGTHLLRLGVPRSDADAILGHYPPDSSLRYMPIQWRDLRLLAARLTLRD